MLKWSGESGRGWKERYLCVKRVKETNFLQEHNQRVLKVTVNIRKVKKELRDGR